MNADRGGPRTNDWRFFRSSCRRVCDGLVFLMVKAHWQRGHLTSDVGGGLTAGWERAGAIFCGWMMAASLGHAQYPAGPQISKDGTAVALQDYASLPISSRPTSTYPPATNYADQFS